VKTAIITVFFTLTFLFTSVCTAEPLSITMSTTLAGKDPRQAYSGLALTLALEKTREEYGDYKILIFPVTMNTARAIEEAKKNTIPNFILLTTFQNKMLDDGLEYTRFPVDLGVTGFRICFVSPNAKIPVSKIKTLDELRQFTIGQGAGWADIDILRYNRFTVTEISSFESLFNMTAANRIDLVCRGINELETELKNHADMKDLDYDRSIAISYPLPRFYFSNNKNTKVLKRITKGLLISYRDGSLQKVWLEQYQSALTFARLKQRRIFYLKTPNIDRIDFDYQKYFFDPLRY
jgi:hypothetical protein